MRLLYWKDTCLAPISNPRRSPARRGVRRRPLRARRDPDIGADRFASGDADFVQDYSPAPSSRSTPAFADCHAGRGASGLFRAVRARIDPQRRRSEGQDRRRHLDGVASSDYVTLKIIAASVGLDPAKDINWVAIGAARSKATFSQTARSMRSCPLRLGLRNCAPGEQAT